MQDRPTAIELLAAVRAFLREDLVPTLEGRRRFHALVAANVLEIVGRELASEEAQLEREWRRLADLFALDPAVPPRAGARLREAVRGLEGRLAEAIRAGEADAEPFAGRVRAHVRTTVLEKLAVADPRAIAGEPHRG